MPSTLTTTIHDFFTAYETRTNNALRNPPVMDAEESAAAFTDCFIEAHPQGVQCGTNDKAFRETILQGYDYYRQLGTQSMNIRQIEVTPLDDFHGMATIQWNSRYQRKDQSEVDIDFQVIYFLQVRDGVAKVFAYIAGDEEGKYKELGLTPNDNE